MKVRNLRHVLLLTEREVVLIDQKVTGIRIQLPLSKVGVAPARVLFP